jgi:PAS domain S-box-containing protein
MRMALLTSAMALVTAGVALLTYDVFVSREAWARELETQINILAQSTAPALAFDDQPAAQNNLAALDARPDVRAAAVYRSDGGIYAEYVPHNLPPPPRQQPVLPVKLDIEGAHLEFTRPIALDNERLGTIYVHARYDIGRRLIAYASILVVVMLLSLLAASAFSARLQRGITGPLDEIAKVSRDLILDRDYSARVQVSADGEIGIVVAAFNRMLDEVQHRTAALQASNASLLQEIKIRETAQASLRLANTRLESTMAAAEIGNWVWDLKAQTFSVDRNFAALHGLSDVSEVSTDPQQRHARIHPEDVALAQAAEADALRSGTLASRDYRIQQPDGSVRWVIARGKTQYDADGAAVLLAGVLVDVTERMKAEERVRESERLYRAIGESIEYGVWVCDAHGRNTYASESFLRLVGMTQEECSNFGWQHAMHPEDADETMRAWQECVRTGSPWYREHRFRGNDGQYRPVLAQGVPIRTETGEISGWAGINLDISRLKRSEQALLEANRRKDEFLATLAHELRNPLAALSAAAQLMAKATQKPAVIEVARDALTRQVEHMARLLDDLLDASRITHGRLNLRVELQPLVESIQAAIDTVMPMISAKNHRLSLEVRDENLLVEGDRVRLMQVFANLLSNAAKYTDPGGQITVCVSAITSGDDRFGIVSIRDTGIGISHDALERVFEMFSQDQPTLHRSQGGLGIGLSLVRGLLKLHGGTVVAMSEGPGRGSEFIVRLPLSSRTQYSGGAPLPTSSAEPPAANCRRVLVVDDNKDNAMSWTNLLELAGHEVRTAFDGAEALDLIQEWRPEVALLDIGMPSMNGYELARRIHASLGTHRPLLIAMTGWGQEHDRQTALQAGFDHHFTKPVPTADVLHLIAAASVAGDCAPA